MKSCSWSLKFEKLTPWKTPIVGVEWQIEGNIRCSEHLKNYIQHFHKLQSDFYQFCLGLSVVCLPVCVQDIFSWEIMVRKTCCSFKYWVSSFTLHFFHFNINISTSLHFQDETIVFVWARMHIILHTLSKFRKGSLLLLNIPHWLNPGYCPRIDKKRTFQISLDGTSSWWLSFFFFMCRFSDKICFSAMYTLIPKWSTICFFGIYICLLFRDIISRHSNIINQLRGRTLANSAIKRSRISTSPIKALHFLTSSGLWTI